MFYFDGNFFVIYGGDVYLSDGAGCFGSFLDGLEDFVYRFMEVIFEGIFGELEVVYWAVFVELFEVIDKVVIFEV